MDTQGGNVNQNQPPKREPRGAAGRTEAASRGGKKSASLCKRAPDGTFIKRKP